MSNIEDFEPNNPISKVMNHIHLQTLYIPHKGVYELKCRFCGHIESIPERDVFDLPEQDFTIMTALDKIIQRNLARDEARGKGES